MSRGTSLIDEAARAREHAYAPYSHLHVGAAVRLRDGRVFVGVNVENASYGLTVCAERHAVAAAMVAGAKAGDVVEVAVIADTPRPIVPCGACRQVLLEVASPDCMVTMGTTRAGTSLRLSLHELLPHSFGPSDLPNP